MRRARSEPAGGGASIVAPRSAPRPRPIAGPRPPAVALLSSSAFPPTAVFYAIALVGVVAIRAHELVPQLAIIRPALVLSLLSLWVVVLRATPAARSLVMRDTAVKLALCYFGWAILTAPISLWPSAALIFGLTSGMPAVVMLVVLLHSQPTQRNIDRLTIGFVAVAAIHIVGLRALGVAGVDGRLSGEGAFDSNDLASLAAITFPLALSLLLRQKGRIRVLGWAGAGISLASMVWFNSRGGTLAMVAGILTFIALQQGRRRWTLLGLVAGGVVVTWVTASQEYRDRITGISDLDNDYNVTSYDGREQVWKRARGYIAENPFTGVGINNFPVKEGLTLKEAGLHGKWSTTHNAYLQATAELGLPGGAIFVAILVTGMARALRLARPKVPPGVPTLSRPEYLSSLVAFASGAYFLSHAYFYALFALTGMVAFTTRVAAGQSAAAIAAMRGDPLAVANPRRVRSKRIG